MCISFNNTLNEAGSGPVSDSGIWCNLHSCRKLQVVFTTDAISTSGGGSLAPKPVFFSCSKWRTFPIPIQTGLGITGNIYHSYSFKKKLIIQQVNLVFKKWLIFQMAQMIMVLYANNAGGSPRFCNVYDASTATYTDFGPVLNTANYYLMTIVRNGVFKWYNFFMWMEQIF